MTKTVVVKLTIEFEDEPNTPQSYHRILDNVLGMIGQEQGNRGLADGVNADSEDGDTITNSILIEMVSPDPIQEGRYTRRWHWKNP